MLPMLATLDTDLADDVMPSDEDAPVSLSMAVTRVCKNVVLLIESAPALQREYVFMYSV